MGEGLVPRRARCAPRLDAQLVVKLARDHPVSGWRVGLGIQLKWSLVIGALVAWFTCVTNARAVDCFPSADGVRQQRPEAWPSWTLRAPGHQGSKCWYAATRSTAHQHPKWTAAPVRSSETIVPNPPSLGLDAATLPLSTDIPMPAISDENRSNHAPTRTATIVQPNMRDNDEDQRVAVSPLDGFSARRYLASESGRPTNQAVSVPAFVTALGGALVLASLISGFFATRRERTRGGHERLKRGATRLAAQDQPLKFNTPRRHAQEQLRLHLDRRA